MANKQKPYVNTKVKYKGDGWLELHKTGIGGSDAGAIAGFNPYESPFTVYYEKTGGMQPKEITEAMRQGTDLEEYVRSRFVEKTGKQVIKK